VKACVFPGQGSQVVGMGEGLFERHPEMVAAADEILGYSVAELCLEDPQGRLHQTQYTQPALFVVNALSYLSRCSSGALPPDFVAGHSLGEYNALLAAGVFDFESGLRLVKLRAQLMSQASGGRMAAVLGCDEEKVLEILKANGLHAVDVANYNTPIQVVLSGPAEEIARAETLFTEIGATYTPLNVSAAFHSRAMEPFLEPLGEALEQTAFHSPRIPVLSNVEARPYEVHELKDHLRRQIREPVRWTEIIRYLLNAGVVDFEEVGPGSVLMKLVRSIRKRSAPSASAPAPSARTMATVTLTAESLGSDPFRRDYGVRRALVAGAMPRGIASKDLVVRMAKAGYFGFFGAGGLNVREVEESIRSIQRSLAPGEPFGVGLQANPDDPDFDIAIVELCLRSGVRYIEAAGYTTPSPALVRFRLKGNRVMAKVSRPDVADEFLNPPSGHIVAELSGSGFLTADEAERVRRLPAAEDLCVEADPDGSLMDTALLLPAILRQRDEVCRRHGYERAVHVGSAGEIGTPEAAASAFLLGADFILTGFINQCTVEAGTSNAVKDLLQNVGLQDTASAPAGDLFELGARVQVLKKGVSFPVRANRLYELWRRHGSWEEVDASTRAKVERECFGRSFECVHEEVRSKLSQTSPREIERAERDGRHRMALVFRWYFDHAMGLALSGEPDKANYQVLCGPALGAFNQWVKGTPLEPWRQRHVDVIADAVMEDAAGVLNRRFQGLAAGT
jgi:trans-AT polyketide synthase, acyltransferase and oxidoreductase domains